MGLRWSVVWLQAAKLAAEFPKFTWYFLGFIYHHFILLTGWEVDHWEHCGFHRCLAESKHIDQTTCWPYQPETSKFLAEILKTYFEGGSGLVPAIHSKSLVHVWGTHVSAQACPGFFSYSHNFSWNAQTSFDWMKESYGVWGTHVSAQTSASFNPHHLQWSKTICQDGK